MATHDYDIANQTAASARADINDVLDAIVSNNSSASAPSTTFAHMWWFDTTNNQLKMRNENDNAWVTIGEVDSSNRFVHIIGSWEISQDSSNNLKISYNGTGKAKLDSSGNLTVAGNVTAYGTI
jgi:hypothetical protein